MTQTTESGRLLKARDCRGLGSQAAFNFEDIQRRCREMVERARQEAAKILETAQIETQQIREAAFEDARRSGREHGMQDAEDRIKSRATELAQQWVDDKLMTTLPAVQQLSEALTHERERWLAAWETGLVQLAVAIAERIVRRSVDANPNVTADVIRDALRLVAGSSQIRVRLHPQDERRLGRFSDEVSAGLESLADVQFVADESISPGGCLLETEHGLVDARLETQLDRILAELSN